MRRVDKEELNFSHGIIVNAYQRYTVGSKEDLHRKLDFSVRVQSGEYFQSDLADSGIGYYPLLLIIWHFCHKN